MIEFGHALRNIWQLGRKELSSLRRDPVLVVLIVYAFTLSIYSVAAGANTEVRNAAVGMVDEDGSVLSRRIADAVLPPRFQAPETIPAAAVDAAMDAGRYTFVLDVPPRFESDLLSGRDPVLQLSVDATSVTQAAAGAAYLTQIIEDEVRAVLRQHDVADPPIDVVVRSRFNPNLESKRFTAVMQVINNITILGIILVGAAVLREREHGTLDHLLAMPIRPIEIMLAKIWANGATVLIASLLSLFLVVRGVLAVPLAGSIGLFIVGLTVYLFAVTTLGIALTTVVRSVAQFGLLAIPVFIVMTLLSGSWTPVEGMPRWLQLAMQISPSTHFVAFAQGVLYRGAGLGILWPQLAAMAGIGGALFVAALLRFRRTLAEVG